MGSTENTPKYPEGEFDLGDGWGSTITFGYFNVSPTRVSWWSKGINQSPGDNPIARNKNENSRTPEALMVTVGGIHYARRFDEIGVPGQIFINKSSKEKADMQPLSDGEVPQKVNQAFDLALEKYRVQAQALMPDSPAVAASTPATGAKAADADPKATAPVAPAAPAAETPAAPAAAVASAPAAAAVPSVTPPPRPHHLARDAQAGHHREPQAQHQQSGSHRHAKLKGKGIPETAVAEGPASGEKLKVDLLEFGQGRAAMHVTALHVGP